MVRRKNDGWINRNRNRNKEIDTIQYKERLGISYFQGFLTFYKYKEEVIRDGAFY